MFETVPWLSWMSLTIKHKHFNPHILIFHIHELSITSLCSRAQCAPLPHLYSPKRVGVHSYESKVRFDEPSIHRYRFCWAHWCKSEPKIGPIWCKSGPKIFEMVEIADGNWAEMMQIGSNFGKRPKWCKENGVSNTGRHHNIVRWWSFCLCWVIPNIVVYGPYFPRHLT